jgi:hypothetical protein
MIKYANEIKRTHSILNVLAATIEAIHSDDDIQA